MDEDELKELELVWDSECSSDHSGECEDPIRPAESEEKRKEADFPVPRMSHF